MSVRMCIFMYIFNELQSMAGTIEAEANDLVQ